MSFEDFKNLQVGDIYYESGYGAVIKATVLSKPQSKEEEIFDDKKEYLTWISSTCYFDKEENKFSEEKKETSYGVTKGLTHYGPQCYKSFGIWDREEQKMLDSIPETV